MPGFNQRGPMGQGPMSGRKMGRCTNFGANIKPETSATNTTPTDISSQNNAERGMGLGNGMRQGRGMGMGRQHRFRNGQ